MFIREFYAEICIAIVEVLYYNRNITQNNNGGF